MKSFIQLRENNLTEALYDVKWGIGMERQVVAKDPAEAIRKAKADLLKSKPKLADPKYADDWKNPRVHKIRESKINEETMELAGATFQNMEHCPGAVSAFKQNLKDGAKEEDVVKAAKAVDAYLAIEDKAKRSGATEADINKMKDLIGKAKSVISQLGLKGHMYHDMHLARVKKMMNEGIGLEESITRMSNSRLKFHAMFGNKGE
jgi:NTP pyrophosphatase (non-canonical NTP hydrolase)